MSARYERLFAEERGALIPFLMLGDPDPDACLVLIDELIAAGADALELGLPFSDASADGPVLVAAANRALAAGMDTARSLRLVTAIRKRHPGIPIGLLVYANLVFAAGIDDFYRRAAAAGADSVLVPDLPLRESAPFRAAASRHGIAPVFILPPDAGEATTEAVATASRGYTYVLGRRGVTGDGRAAAVSKERLDHLRALGAAPLVIGFGISEPAHYRAALTAGAAGAIVGSALVDHLARGGDAASFIAKFKAQKRRLQTTAASGAG